MTDAAHAAAILNALAAAGWPATHLADRLGISPQTIAAIRDQRRPHLRIPIDQDIRRLYPRLANTSPAAAGIPPGTIARALAYHQRRHTTEQSPVTTA
ncbi:helix-turn-helix domain-containing protein [Streptomyces sp. PA03-6a]|nr:helix-turn-helix domain-containing protein [Streptomyces sp. PA03-6a]